MVGSGPIKSLKGKPAAQRPPPQRIPLPPHHAEEPNRSPLSLPLSLSHTVLTPLKKKEKMFLDVGPAVPCCQSSAPWMACLGLASVSCSSLPRPPPGTDRVSGPLGACRGARAVAVLVPSATAPTFKRQIEPAQAPPTRALDVSRHTHHRSATPPSPPAVVGWQGHVLPSPHAPAAPSRP